MNDMPDVPILLLWFLVIAAPILLALDIKDWWEGRNND